jgi:hypothetical protein
LWKQPVEVEAWDSPLPGKPWIKSKKLFLNLFCCISVSLCFSFVLSPFHDSWSSSSLLLFWM